MKLFSENKRAVSIKCESGMRPKKRGAGLAKNALRVRRLNLREQAGVAILEALIAILIFSIGVLGIVGLQARSVQGLGEAGFRSQAVQLADELIAEMWTSDPGIRRAYYQAGGNGYNAWASKVTTGTRRLPGATAHMPTVVVTSTRTPIGDLLPGTDFFTSDVTITILWVPPGAPAGSPPNQYVTTARILEPQL
jgi:type IV pilus assembly protein PilV